MNSTHKREVPIMGTNAILSRHMNQLKNRKDDSEIIAELVTEKFLGSFTVHANSSNENDEEYLVNEVPPQQPSGNVPNIIVSSTDNQYVDCTNSNTKFEFDEEIFLKEALGDALHDYASSEYSEIKIGSTRSHSSNSSIGTSRVSSLMNTLYSSFTAPLERRRNTYTSSPLSEKLKSDDGFSEVHSLDTTAGFLIHQAAVQYQIIAETSKALNVCFSSKEFMSGPERVEAEKILLLAVYKKDLIFKELPRLQYENLTCDAYGKITISKMSFPPIDVNLVSQEEPNRWFTTIVSCGTNVMGTDVITSNDNGELHFQSKFEFDDLMPDFEIVISLYSLVAKSHPKISTRQSTLHIKEGTVRCPIPRKLFHKHCKKHVRAYYSYERRDPSFILWGTAVLRKTDLNHTSCLSLNQVPSNATIRGIVLLDISHNVHFTMTHSGFLTVKSESDKYTPWDRRWCYLNSYTLSYWNYPADQDSQEAIQSIDLRCCISPKIGPVDRELCSKPTTLLLEIAHMKESESTFTIKYYLSADNSSEMSAWEKHLNSVLSSLKYWNLMKCEVHHL